MKAMELNPYEAPHHNVKRRRRRFRYMLLWLAKRNVIRVQITLVLGCVGVMVATWFWLARGDFGWPAAFRIIAIVIGVVSTTAVMEGVWKLDN
jgi:hypothetical protein